MSISEPRKRQVLSDVFVAPSTRVAILFVVSLACIEKEAVLWLSK